GFEANRTTPAGIMPICSDYWEFRCVRPDLEKKLEPAVGFEPTTDGLQNRCSTTELSWRIHGHVLPQRPVIHGCVYLSQPGAFCKCKPACCEEEMHNFFGGAPFRLRRPGEDQ